MQAEYPGEWARLFVLGDVKGEDSAQTDSWVKRILRMMSSASLNTSRLFFKKFHAPIIDLLRVLQMIRGTAWSIFVNFTMWDQNCERYIQHEQKQTAVVCSGISHPCRKPRRPHLFTVCPHLSKEIISGGVLIGILLPCPTRLSRNRRRPRTIHED